MRNCLLAFVDWIDQLLEGVLGWALRGEHAWVCLVCLDFTFSVLAEPFEQLKPIVCRETLDAKGNFLCSWMMEMSGCEGFVDFTQPG
jgi:hypothetical protein